MADVCQEHVLGAAGLCRDMAVAAAIATAAPPLLLLWTTKSDFCEGAFRLKWVSLDFTRAPVPQLQSVS